MSLDNFNIFSVPNQLVFAGLIVAIIFIMISGIWYAETVQAHLKQPLVHVTEFNLDYWSVSHFLLFAWCGFVKPGFPLTFFLLGGLFELFEDVLSSDSNTKIFNCMDSLNKSSKIGTIVCNGVQDSYWYAKVDDLAINLIGYVCGQALRTTCYPTIL
jgi:hypothetical protein